MNKKNSDNLFLANTNEQSLKEHSIAIALYGHLLLKSLKFKESIEKEINQCLIYSALLHDIGKISSSFQNYIKSKKAKNNDLTDIPMDTEASRPKGFKGPYHNEISWAYIANFIEFSNNDIEDIIYHSVYWHHPANCSEKEDKMRFENSKALIEKIEENISELLDKIYRFTKDLFYTFSSNYYSNDFYKIDLKNPKEVSIKRIQYPYFFSHKKDKVAYNAKQQLCLNLLLESDRKVSSWTPAQLKDFLNTWKTYQVSVYKTNKFSIRENLEDNPKSKEQNQLAQKMSDKSLAVCGVDPAGGKTSVSLYWWDECNNEYPLIIALPRQNQVTGLFESLKIDLKRVYGTEKINLETVFNGKRQDDNWKDNNWKPESPNDLLVSDINILVFDRFLSPYYKRSQSSEFLKMLKSHLILDEFHEFKDLPKMIPSLKEILTIRSWLESEVKTLMLSGTPEPSLLNLLCVEKESRFDRTELSPRDNHKFKIYLEQKDKEETPQFIPDCLYSFLKVEFCQNVFSLFFKNMRDKIKMIHSYFTVSDKKELLQEILKEHGKKEEFISDNSVITAKMLQSSYNLSFDKAIVELSQPYTDCQTAGRVNRFENKPNAEMHFIYNEDTEKFFKEAQAGFKEVHTSWKKHISYFIEKHKGQDVSIRKLMECYDNFWNDKSNMKESLNILEKRYEKAIEELNKYIPKRFSGKKIKISSLNSLFRGDSQYLSACVVNDNGEPVDQLHGEDLLSEGRKWFIDIIKTGLQNCLKTKSKKANKINGEEVFEYKKQIKVFGFKEERPLLCSHINGEIDKCLSDNLQDEDDSTNHRVYHKKFGLVKIGLVKKSLLEK